MKEWMGVLGVGERGRTKFGAERPKVLGAEMVTLWADSAGGGRCKGYGVGGICSRKRRTANGEQRHRREAST